MENTPIHTRSRACQKRLKQNSRRTTVVRRPRLPTCAIITSSHSRPELTWQPWVPIETHWARETLGAEWHREFTAYVQFCPRSLFRTLR